MDNIEKAYDDRNWMDMSDDKEYDERYQISKNGEKKVTEYRYRSHENGKWSSQKNMENIEKAYDDRNRMIISDDREYDERYHISKHYE